ncbi:MAG: hypothetical protein FFODKBPE_00238 [Candidatus Argoarchaeum ethanivorans]|uniref:Uncharacterized protein n=1 Tax=Candidatus Argoarchaeum ethanivorans TaxID=2608793 RepID=A0A811T8W3_9EURY|nr:MAG: hypothetical protein FFODKBPE_00238 [Candidatus Argoarchaeum ethanivorans]
MKQMTLDEMLSTQNDHSLHIKDLKGSSKGSDQIIRIRLPNPTFPEESRVQALLFAIHFSRFLQGAGYTQIKLNTVNLAIEFKSDRSGEEFLDGLFDKYAERVEDGVFARFEKSASLSMAGYDYASPKTFESELKEVTGYDLEGKQSDKLPYRERVFVDALKGMRDAVDKKESRPFVDAEKFYSKICPFCGLSGGNRGKPIRIMTLSSAEKLGWRKGKGGLVACSRCVCMGNVARITVPWITQLQTGAKQGSDTLWLVNHFESTKPMLTDNDLAEVFKEYREYEYVLLTPRIRTGIKASRDQLFNVFVRSPVLSRFLTETIAEDNFTGDRILRLKCSALIQKEGSNQAEVEGEYDWNMVHETARFALACSRVFRGGAIANASGTGYQKHLSDSLLVLRDTRSAYDAARYLIEKITLDFGSDRKLSLEQVGKLLSISSGKDTKEVLEMVNLELMKNPTNKGTDIGMLDHNDGFLRYTAGLLEYRAIQDKQRDSDQVIGDAYSRLYKVREDTKAEIITDFIEFLTDKGGMKSNISNILHPEAISMCSQVLYNFTPDEMRIYAKLLRIYATIYSNSWNVRGDTLAKEVLKELELQ